MRLSPWAAALMIVASPAAATEPRPRLDGPSQQDINGQAAGRYRVADREMNTVYAQLMARATPDGRERLTKAQRAWIAFRDLDCAARAGSRGGSFHPAAQMLCLEAATDARTKTLRDELDCPENDMACGGVRQD